MAESIAPQQTYRIPHPGKYEINALSGNVVVIANGEPQKLKDAPKGRSGKTVTVSSEGHVDIYGIDHSLVDIVSLDTPEISAQQAASSSKARPEAASKAAGKTAADASQAPSAPKAQKSRPSSARTRGAKTNKPTTSQIEARATGTDPAKRLAEPRKASKRSAAKKRK